MAVKKKTTTKPRKASPKITKTKPSLDLSRISKNLKTGYEKRKALYIGVFIIILVAAGFFSLFWFNKGLFLAGTINGSGDGRER